MGNINYNGKTFKSVSNTDNGEVSAETIFHYSQQGNIVTATYSGGGILAGSLIAVVDEQGDARLSTYPKTSAQRKQIQAQAKWSMAS